MDTNEAAKALTTELEGLLRKKMEPLFNRYGLNLEDLLTPLKWKPLVLIIGNYSSGKSTFINEVLDRQIQRTGQAPTDDSFTILTAPEENETEDEVPGNSIVSDTRLPFGALRKFGESFLAHFRLKRVDAPILKELAIIDTPGMLDSVTEKDRGYNYLGVVGEMAKLADLIVLMFDPHKAGTIKETYQAIRSTLPGSSGEDRVLYVLNRIDECDNISDLVRAYGTLCWNLSQMTGRKDMPRIYLTYAPDTGRNIPPGFEIWAREREELKDSLRSAPRMRLNHILQEVDSVVRELEIEVHSLASFKEKFLAKFFNSAKAWGIGAILAFFFGDLITHLLFGYPENTFIGSLLSGSVGTDSLLWPIVWALMALVAASIYMQRWMFPKFIKNTLEHLDDLVPLETAYQRDLWSRTRQRVQKIISDQARHIIWVAHKRNLNKIEHFLNKDLSRFYEEVAKK